MGDEDVRCAQCGARCDYASAQKAYGSCRGTVSSIDQRADADETDGTHWVHACRAHARLWFGGPYLTSPTPVGTTK